MAASHIRPQKSVAIQRARTAAAGSGSSARIRWRSRIDAHRQLPHPQGRPANRFNVSQSRDSIPNASAEFTWSSHASKRRRRKLISAIWREVVPIYKDNKLVEGARSSNGLDQYLKRVDTSKGEG